MIDRERLAAPSEVADRAERNRRGTAALLLLPPLPPPPTPTRDLAEVSDVERVVPLNDVFALDEMLLEVLVLVSTVEFALAVEESAIAQNPNSRSIVPT